MIVFARGTVGRLVSGGSLGVANHFNRPVKIKIGTVFFAVAGTADLFNNAARAFTSQSDDIAVSLGIRLLYMAFSRTVAGLTLYTGAVWFGVAAICAYAGYCAVELIRVSSIIDVYTCMRG